MAATSSARSARREAPASRGSGRGPIPAIGVDRLLFGSDYPYRPGPDDGVAAYLARCGLNLEDQTRVASGNWEALVAAIRR